MPYECSAERWVSGLFGLQTAVVAKDRDTDYVISTGFRPKMRDTRNRGRWGASITLRGRLISLPPSSTHWLLRSRYLYLHPSICGQL